jgi:hypothetical protein
MEVTVMDDFEMDPRQYEARRLRPQRGDAFLVRLLRAAGCAAVLAVSGCAYYPYPVATTAAPANFDRSFGAAVGAMRDQGLTITTEDPGSGTIVGRIGGGTVTTSVLRQADGSVRVQFDATGPRDPALIDRVSRSYDSRMGR